MARKNYEHQIKRLLRKVNEREDEKMDNIDKKIKLEELHQRRSYSEWNKTKRKVTGSLAFQGKHILHSKGDHKTTLKITMSE